MRATAAALRTEGVSLVDFAGYQASENAVRGMEQVISQDGLHPTPQGARVAWSGLLNHLAQHGSVEPTLPTRCRRDGQVLVNGELLPATRRCSWGAGSVEQVTQPCPSASIFARNQVDKAALEIVIAQHEEDISWTEPYQKWRTVYRKGPPVGALPNSSMLPNVGREQHAYVTHITRNYDHLAERTVFLHGKLPTCGVLLHDVHGRVGNHLLANVSAHDYFEVIQPLSPNPRVIRNEWICLRARCQLLASHVQLRLPRGTAHRWPAHCAAASLPPRWPT